MLTEPLATYCHQIFITLLLLLFSCCHIWFLQPHWLQHTQRLCPPLSSSLLKFMSTESSMLSNIQPVHSEGDQPWVFFGRNDAKAETPILWPPHAKSWLIGKDSDAGRDWGQEEKGMTEDEMAGRHHQLDGHECEWAPGDGDGQGGLADTTEQLNKRTKHLILCCPRRSSCSSVFNIPPDIY